MKSINHLFRSFIIVCLALISCEKEKHPQSVDPEQPAVVVRTISVSFDTKSTRTELVGVKPYFKDGDLIKMAQVDGEAESQVCTVKVVDKKASVETTLEGKLKAVYPYGCAVVSNNKITGVSVPESQNGTFEEAHICMAVQESDDDESLEFQNQTPILRFYVDESIQVQSITITPSSGSAITVSPSSGTHFTSSVLDDPDKRICYAAVPSGINANNFTFSSTTGTQGTVVQTLKATTSLANGTMYNIFIPYYIDLGDAGKWGYCNVGAFLPEEPGKYFAWGDTVGQTWTGSQFIEGGFEDIPYYVDVPAPEILPLEKDAANVIWGEDWRMPSVDDCSNLADLDPTCRSWKTDFHGATGWLEPNSGVLFFPATGFAPGTPYVQSEDSSYGYYYTRNSVSMDLGDDYILSAAFTFLVWHNLDEQKVTANDEPSTLDCGCSIRPIYVGGSSEPDDPKIDMNGTLGPIGKSDL